MSRPSHMRRLGRFQITRHLMETEPEMVMQLMGNMIVLEARMCMGGYFDSVEYQAASPLFDPIEPGYIIPTYTLGFIKQDDGTHIVTVNGETRT